MAQGHVSVETFPGTSVGCCWPGSAELIARKGLSGSGLSSDIPDPT